LAKLRFLAAWPAVWVCHSSVIFVASGNERDVSARGVLVTLAFTDLVAWVLALRGVGGEVPPVRFIAFDVALEAFILIGLWLFWQVAWWVAVVGTILGELTELARVANWSEKDGVLVAVGIVQLGLLMLPQLRTSIGGLGDGRVR
jgi:hypothetical protein